VAWRSVVVSHPAKLRREHYSLVVEQAQAARVPFEDIAVIVLNHREITVTHPVLSACGDYGIALFSTGDNHQPNGVFTPYLPHSRATRMLRLQLAIDRPRAKRAWAEIVRAKITNQAICLQLAGKDGNDRLDSYARRVRSGDTGRMEAQAAAYYFSQLLGRGFDRGLGIWANAALDYGYAVLRGAITRGLIAHGLHPSIGLFHASEQNAFNLADDLVEPFRPLVDLHVVTHRRPSGSESQDLAAADKVALVALLNADVRMPRGEMTVLAAVELATEALARLYEGRGDEALELPRVIALRQHRLDT
jgi:CRISPR-associated protein Cas1